MLGIDVGERRIGVAASEGRIAVPLTIIEHTRREDDLARIAEIAQREAAVAIVVGLPLAPDGGEGEQARLTRKFGEQLASIADVPVIFEDERLTSVDAAAVRSRRGKPIDDLAAAAILQRHIDALERAAS
jgi:putative Holliday junction resolvase